MTEAYRGACGFELGDQLTITMPEKTATVPDAKSVRILPVITSDAERTEYEGLGGDLDGTVRLYLKRAEQVFPGMKFECVGPGAKQIYLVLSVDGRKDNVAKFVSSTAARIGDGDDETEEMPDEMPETREVSTLEVAGIPGLPAESEKLNRFLRGFNGKFFFRGHHKSCGLVIHGGRGTGKSHMLDRIAETGWGRVFRIEDNDKSSTVEEVFKQARSLQPSIILIDGLQTLIGKDRANSSAIVHRLGQQLDQLAEEASRNDELPKVVVVATCLDYMADVPPELQKTTRFRFNIPLSIPNAKERLEILEALDVPVQDDVKDAVLKSISQQTHAFTPDDLATLVERAMDIAEDRLRQSFDPDTTGRPHLLKEEMEAALRCTKATAMHDINLKPPTVHWQDVGGQESLKKALRNMLTLTTTTSPAVRKLILTPPKGMLLYGPPGCSKTLSAQAMATESGFNFFAVKGAELLNMYVGESERAVRQLFERARAASPSIIFFDEIDSIGGQRTGSGSTKSQGAVNMLTTLLTEMDGFESLSGVLILAATNRPEAMDPALLRPGRFDRIVYVGPPDAPAREAVFKLYLGKLPTADDVDLAELSRLSEGFSGAEIKQIVTTATEPALERALNGAEENEALVCMQDVVEAIRSATKGITREMMDGYERWSGQFHKHQYQK
ncbi:ATPase family gene 2 protein [Colletotrichum sidae]|uniref:ATPase family gene 2 protein n=1 Tax=Colletotrichum sidae TaxID=1347389 RepID=A0A4R8T4I2_9PEZI|nr:ATPase family gene 2 protein [Colletotrichum sidae]